MVMVVVVVVKDKFYMLYVDDVCRDIYDKMRADLRLSKEEAQRIETSRAPKVTVTHSFIFCMICLDIGLTCILSTHVSAIFGCKFI